MLCNYQLGKSLVCIRAEGGAQAPRAPPPPGYATANLSEILSVMLNAIRNNQNGEEAL